MSNYSNIKYSGTAEFIDSDYIQARQIVSGGFTVPYTYEGQLNVNTGIYRKYIHNISTLNSADLFLTTAPLGSAVVISINKNDSGISTISLDSGQTVSLNNIIDISFTQGDYLTVDIDQVGSRYSGKDLVMNLLFS